MIVILFINTLIVAYLLYVLYAKSLAKLSG